VKTGKQSIAAIKTGVRPVEWILAVFFLYSSALALLLPVEFGIRARTLAVNALVFAVCAVLAVPEDTGRGRWAAIARDWLALALALLAYKQMGWFAPAVHSYQLEHGWIVWDRLILTDWGLKALIEGAGPGIPAVLELSYLLVYAVGPLCVAVLYAYGRREDVKVFLLVYVVGLLLSYAQFPLWPSEPPRTVFPADLLPLDSVLRRANLFLVGKAGIHTSVFPSGHVSGVFAAAFAMRMLLRENAWVANGLFFYSCLVAVATVYGRYHYVVDAIAGIFVAIAALAISRVLLSRSERVSAETPGSKLTKDSNTTVSAS
jgi:membrane-associated phospholipid phosphatase